MADQRQSGSGSKRRAGGKAKKAIASGNVSELRDALGELVDPLGLVVLTRERIEEALNDAVSRGRVTADDAQELAAALVERGRRQTNEVIGEIEQLLATKADRARRAAGIAPKAGVPIAGYDDLTAAQVQSELDGLTPAQLRMLRDHERRNANRKTVLRAIDQRLK
jgi:polyhydroxyalkanoate synthesis regulator phasin